MRTTEFLNAKLIHRRGERKIGGLLFSSIMREGGERGHVSYNPNLKEAEAAPGRLDSDCRPDANLPHCWGEGVREKPPFYGCCLERHRTNGGGRHAGGSQAETPAFGKVGTPGGK